MATRELEARASARRRIAAAARGTMLLDGIRRTPWDELGDSAGASPRSVRLLFRDEDDLLDEITAQLIRETADRLAEASAAPGSGDDPRETMGMLVLAVIRTRPLDRSGLGVRLERRARAIRRGRRDDAARAAEQRYLALLSSSITALLSGVGREPRVPGPDLARTLLNVYERAFEAWLVAGHTESSFEQSRFASDTLPTLALALTRPRPRTEESL